MVGFVVEELLDAVDHPAAAGDHPVDAVARVVPGRQPDRPAFAVATPHRVFIELAIAPRRIAQKLHLFSVEQGRDQDRTLAFVGCKIGAGEGTGPHVDSRG